MRTFKFGEKASVKQLITGSYFFWQEKLYVKDGTTKDKATFFLCHPVAGGQRGGIPSEIVQVGVNAWLSGDESVHVAQITVDT